MSKVCRIEFYADFSGGFRTEENLIFKACHDSKIDYTHQWQFHLQNQPLSTGRLLGS